MGTRGSAARDETGEGGRLWERTVGIAAESTPYLCVIGGARSEALSAN